MSFDSDFVKFHFISIAGVERIETETEIFTHFSLRLLNAWHTKTLLLCFFYCKNIKLTVDSEQQSWNFS